LTEFVRIYRFWKSSKLLAGVPSFVVPHEPHMTTKANLYCSFWQIYLTYYKSLT
jgi:hypothetical protein